MSDQVNNRVSVLPNRLSLTAHFEVGVAPLRGIDVCSMCMMPRFQQMMDAESLVQRGMGRMQDSLRLRFYQEGLKPILGALDRATVMFTMNDPPALIRQMWDRDLDKIVLRLAEQARIEHPKAALRRS